ncbi:heart- and neural crest derivatives-expressed protein 2 isoform X2 [Rhea pennata]
MRPPGTDRPSGVRGAPPPPAARRLPASPVRAPASRGRMEGGRVPEYANGAPGMDHSHYGGVPPGSGPPGLGGPRPVKRRGTANRKERRRTQSINSAFAELRECIPNVPADTKLSKIKTLRLATSYIAYLMDLLAKDDQNGEAEAFKAEIKKTDVKEEKRKKELNEILKSTVSSNDKKTKGRTGWPQHVWALELKQ